MRSKLVYFFAGALVALISSAATRALDAKPAIRKGSQVNLSPEDYIEILHLINQYPRDVDPGAVRDASWMYAPDGRQTNVSASYVPRLKFADHKYWFSSLIGPEGQATKGGVRHFNTTPVIVGLPDGTARASSYMFQVSIKQKGAEPTIDSIGKYEDLYVKTKDGWRIKERINQADSFIGSYQKVAPSPVLSIPSTWTTWTNEYIARQLAAGLTRDENGAPTKR